jgi:hypothetical protein
MKTSQMSGCKAFSIQNIDEYRNMRQHHNTFGANLAFLQK